MEDLRSAAQQLTLDADGDGVTDQWGFYADLWDMELFWGGAIWGHGGEVISEDRTQTLIGEPAAREAWQMISDMINVDGSMADPDSAAQFGDPFAAGVAAMTTIGHWVVPEYSDLEFAWDVAAFPAGPARRATSVNSAGFVIANESEVPDAAFEFIKFALSEAGQSKLTELGFALPVLKSVAESPAYLEQEGAAIRQQVFLDATEYAVTKPSFRGYEEWATIIGDGLYPVWIGETEINAALDEIVPAADDVLANNQ
jgi:multiple sugar transport system substrate-binding protein